MNQFGQSVPPVWTAIQNHWQQSDASDEDDQLFDENLPLVDRHPWWEETVDRLVKDHGILSLV